MSAHRFLCPPIYKIQESIHMQYDGTAVATVAKSCSHYPECDKRQATSEAVVPRKPPRRNLAQDIAAAAGDD